MSLPTLTNPDVDGAGGAIIHGSVAVSAGSASQGTSGSPTKIDQFTADGPASGITPDHGNDKLTIVTSGTYFITFYASFTGSNSTTYIFELYVNGSPTGIRCQRKIGTGTDVGTTMLNGDIALSAADELDVRVTAAPATVCDLKDARLSAHKIG